MLMAESNNERCGQCGAEIDASRRVDFTLKDGTRFVILALSKGRLGQHVRSKAGSL
jgi:hypothetical protein